MCCATSSIDIQYVNGGSYRVKSVKLQEVIGNLLAKNTFYFEIKLYQSTIAKYY